MKVEMISMQYGVDPRSHIYINDGKGHFSDMKPEDMDGLDRVGMVTGAVWARVLNSKEKDLVVVGEWMSPRIFSFRNGKFKEEVCQKRNAPML